MIQRDSVITIIGGTGFLGSYLVHMLAAYGAKIKVLSRYASKHHGLKMFGAVGQIALQDIDVKDYHSLEKGIIGSDYVVNLVGIMHNDNKQTFAKIHEGVAGEVAKLCKKHHIKKLVHVSALGVDRAVVSKYAASKLVGEKLVLKHFPTATIFRPGVMFGHEDNFINLFNSLTKFSPLVPLIGGGKTKFQPIYVDDVARAIVSCLNFEGDKLQGCTYELGGPSIYTMKAIFNYILTTTKRKRLLFPIPFSIAGFIARFLELLPSPLLTRDQVKLLQYDNILFGKNGLDEYGIKPTPMESIMNRYLGSK